MPVHAVTLVWHSNRQTPANDGFFSSLLDRLGYHGDGAARALGGAHAAALAEVVVELEAVARPELDHRVVGAHAVAIVAFEAVAAGETAARLVERVGLVERLDHLLEGRAAAREIESRPHRLGSIRIVPVVELVEARELVLGRRGILGAAQPRIDVARRLLAVADGDRHGALARHHVAAGEDAGTAGHHVGGDLHDAVLDLQPFDAV